MNAPDALADIASLIGDRSRAAMLWSLMGGESRPATELALIANVSAQTASAHLKLLTDARLIAAESKGRNRFYRLKGTAAASALESLAALGPVRGTTVRQAPELVFARSCYDHLAGELGVAVFQALQSRGWIVADAKSVRLTAIAEQWLDKRGLKPGRRKLVHACLDWSQRVPHLGGAFGTEFLAWTIEEQWLTRAANSRAIRVTALGQRQLRARFGIEFTRNGGVKI